MIDGRFVVTAIAQVNLDFVGVVFDGRDRESSPRLEQIQARANLVTRHGRPRRRTHFDADAGDHNLPLDDKPDSNRSQAATARLGLIDLNSRCCNAT